MKHYNGNPRCRWALSPDGRPRCQSPVEYVVVLEGDQCSLHDWEAGSCAYHAAEMRKRPVCPDPKPCGHGVDALIMRVTQVRTAFPGVEPQRVLRYTEHAGESRQPLQDGGRDDSLSQDERCGSSGALRSR